MGFRINERQEIFFGVDAVQVHALGIGIFVDNDNTSLWCSSTGAPDGIILGYFQEKILQPLLSAQVF